MDLYAVLGLEAGASSADIKRAYRRLARRYHPGINPGDRAAAALFRRISDAYEVLVDPVRRQHYDLTGAAIPAGTAETLAFAGFDFSVAAQGTQAATFTELFAEVLHPVAPADAGRPEQGADIHAALTVPFLDAVRGVQRQVVVTRQDLCSGCGGSGHVAAAEARCVPCQASGSIRWARGHMVFSKPCTACGGTGRQRQHRCQVCGAQGRVVRSDAIPVLLPPGTADGTMVRIPGHGHAGRQGGPSGDLYVTVHVTPHAIFRREGYDLRLTVPVAVHEAVLGARIEVPSLDGDLRMRIPPGTQAGQQFRIEGRGVPRPGGGRGELVVDVRLVLPSTVDERSKALMREFGRINDEDVRRELRV